MARRVTKNITTVRPNGSVFRSTIDTTFHDSRGTTANRVFRRIKFGISSLTAVMLFIAFFRFVGVSFGIPDPFFINMAAETTAPISDSMFVSSDSGMVAAVDPDLVFFDVFGFLKVAAASLNDLGQQISNLVKVVEIPMDTVGNQAFSWLNFIIYVLNVALSLWRFAMLWPFEIMNAVLGSFFTYLFGGADGWLHHLMTANIPYLDMTAAFEWIMETGTAILNWFLNQLNVMMSLLPWNWGLW